MPPESTLLDSIIKVFEAIGYESSIHHKFVSDGKSYSSEILLNKIN